MYNKGSFHQGVGNGPSSTSSGGQRVNSKSPGRGNLIQQINKQGEGYNYSIPADTFYPNMQ